MKLNDLYKPEKHYKVLVKTITFNQSKYIQETLAGIAMQITNFPFVNIVLEDHSTDGEQEVIRAWMSRECEMSLAEYYDIPTAELIIAPHKTNENCTFAVYFHKENLFKQRGKREAQIKPWRTNSEYEALCEGDDYWIDPLKLQKQVNFLDENPEYAMVYSKSKQFVQNTNSLKRNSFGKLFRSTKELLLENSIPTPSVLYRESIYDRYIKEIKWVDSRGWLMGDYPMWLFFSLNSKVQFLDEDMVVYRILDNSASHSTSFLQQEKFILSTFEMKRFFNSKYSIMPQSALDYQMQKCLLVNAIRYGEDAIVRKYMKSFKTPPIKLKAYYALYRCKLLWIYDLCKRRTSC